MIRIICVGKIKEKYIKDAIDEYMKRLTKYAKVEIIELNDYEGDNANIIKSKEKKEILKYINYKDYVIVLAIEGKMLTSEEFSKHIDKVFVSNPNITFIIGGSYGIDEEIKSLASLSLSFSKMTFPHQLFRVILLEQIYRAFKINKNESYHK